jgi:TRAP-type C4-dicarboxylate transport system permease small subunit
MSVPQEPGARSAPESAPRPRILPEEILAVACMAVLVLLTLANVVVRYLSDETLAPTEEVSIALMVVMTLAGACAAAARDRHVRIEYFYETGAASRRRRLALFSAAATCVFFVLLGLLSARVVMDEYHYQETSMALGVPRWWYTIWVPVLCAVIAARAAGVLRRVRAGGLLPGPADAGSGAADVSPSDAARASEGGHGPGAAR